MVCLTGCVDLTIQERIPVELVLTPYVVMPISGPAKASVEVAAVTDSRTDVDRSVLTTDLDPGSSHSGLPTFLDPTYKSSNPPTLYTYFTVTPFTDVIEHGLNLALRRNGFEGTNGTLYVLESEITDMSWDDPHSPTVSVNLELKDKATGQSVWKKRCDGKHQTTEGAPDFGRLWSQAAEEVMTQLITDPTFRAFFELQATNAP